MAHANIHSAIHAAASRVEMGTCINTEPVVEAMVERRQSIVLLSC